MTMTSLRKNSKLTIGALALGAALIVAAGTAAAANCPYSGYHGFACTDWTGFSGWAAVGSEAKKTLRNAKGHATVSQSDKRYAVTWVDPTDNNMCWSFVECIGEGKRNTGVAVRTAWTDGSTVSKRYSRNLTHARVGCGIVSAVC